MHIAHPHATARVCLIGAQVASFIPAGHQDALWSSGATSYDPKGMFRGGIPICWPWFGRGEVGAPFHGCARLLRWTVTSVDLSPDRTEL
ncbi:MAG: hypothetical protein H0V44_10310, partial [Planctomycetes bacterium]|nr:hypothetical protein [Planctomycetota bacterium]